MVQEDNIYTICGPTPREPLPDMSLGRFIFEYLISNCSKHDAMIDAVTGEAKTYKNILQQSCNLAEALRICGYERDTVISISSENNLQFFIPVIASLFNGYIIAPVNFNYTPTETKHVLNIAKSRIIFCSKAVSEKFLKIKEEVSHINDIIVMDTDETNAGLQSLSGFISKYLKGMDILPYKFQPLDDDNRKLMAFIVYSSGTTGLPKGVLLSHRNIICRYTHAKDPRYHSIGNEHTVIGILPFFHAYGMLTTLESIIFSKKIIIMKQFDEDIFLQSIEKYRVTTLWLAPPLVVFLAKSHKVIKYDLSSVKEVTCGAAPLSKNVEEQFLQRIKVKSIRQGYGLSEATLAISLLQVTDIKGGSSGKIVPFMKAKFRDPETGKSLGPNQVGEICLKGEMVMMRYFGNPKSTKETFTSDGWLRTGDLGYYDNEEYIFIVDRLKELIKYKGYQVAPAELEGLLLQHSKIRDVGVVGLPDELAGELPLAFVVKHDGVQLTEKEVQDYVAKNVAPHKKLRGGVIFVPEIPKNPSGKILRRELRLLLQKHNSKL